MAEVLTYVVIDVNLITQDMVEESIGEEASVRTSVNGEQVILKFNKKYPNTMGGFKKYTASEMQQYITDNNDFEGYGPTSTGSDFYMEVSKGKIAGHGIINIQGSSQDLDIADGLSQIVNFAKSYIYKTANATLSVVSTDAADTDITVQITGVDENFKEVVEILALNGTTPVTSVKNFIAVNRALIMVSGGITGNQGNITFTHTSDIIAQINANLGSTEHGIFYVPAGKTLMINNVSTSIVRSTASSSIKEVTIRLNVSGTSNSMESSLPIGMRSDSGPFILNLATPQRIPEKSIVSFLATALVNNSAVNAIATGILINDANF